jgi:hypothetical protein
MPEWVAEEIRATQAPMPEWAAEEIRATWQAARAAGNLIESLRILERMVDRLGHGRTRNNPSLVPNSKREVTK